MAAELALLWLTLAYFLAHLPDGGPPWYAVPTALAPWLFLRWPLPRRAPLRTPGVAVLHWARVHTGGLALGFVTLNFFFDVPSQRLWAAAAGGFLVLAGFSAVAVQPLRVRLEARARELWHAACPGAGEAAVPLLGIWLWDRLVLAGALPAASYAWLTVASLTTAWVFRGVKSRWRGLWPALTTVAPLVLALDGTPAAEPEGRLALLVAGTAVAAWAHRFIPSWLRLGAGEQARLWALGLAAVWLAEPLLNPQSVGGGDAEWYALVLADAVAQWRAGFLPPYIGQSLFAFSGSSFPGCFAPYYQMFGVLLDVLTGHTLNAYALKHLAAALSLAGGAFGAYFVLKALAPGRPDRAVGVALLYAASPAWLGAIYGMDMYMTLMTLPWLPPVMLAAVRTYVRLDVRGLLGLVVPLSLVWHAHTPVALWTTLAVGLTQLVRWAQRRHGWRKELGWFAGAGMVFAGLTCVPFVTAYFAPQTVDNFRHDNVIATLGEHWAQLWKPASAGAGLLNDQHLGASLFLLLAAGAGWLWRRRQRALGSLVAATACILLLLIPIPGLLDAAWRLLPDPVKAITNNWPTQRLYPVLAALVLVGAGGACLRALRRRAVAPVWCGVALGAMLVWSGAEADKFRERGRATRQQVGASERKLLPENTVLTRYAYEMFEEKPAYFSDGHMNPGMKNLLLEEKTLRVIADNRRAARRSPVVRDVVLRRTPRGGFELFPSLVLEPGKRYLLEMRFTGRPLKGTLLLQGERIDRSYALPASGPGPKSFGSAPGHPRFLSLWTEGENSETVRFSFLPAAGETAPPVLARARLLEIDPGRLPVVIESLLPYRADIRAPRAAWVVTPRMFLPGYSATVDGGATEVRRSPEGLVMFRVPAGNSRAELRYRPPAAVRAAVTTASAAWIVAAALGIALALPPRLRPGQRWPWRTRPRRAVGQGFPEPLTP